ncbi:hypothetical protein TruAng_012071 [Truncatella angustata]|nr:hypothetical protein TruAng_012071 [Truncatella angustata]
MATSTRDESPASASPISVHKPRPPRRQDFADTNCRLSGSMSEMSNPAATARNETSGSATGWESLRDGTLHNDSKAHRNRLPFDSSPYGLTNQTIGPEHEVGVSRRSSLARNPGSAPFPSGCCSVCNFDKRTLLQHIEKVLQFSCQDEIPWESLLSGHAISSSRQKTAAMLKVSLWALRDYAMGMKISEDGEMGTEASGVTGRSVDSWNVGPTTDGISVFSHGSCHLNEQSPLSRKVGHNRIRASIRDSTGHGALRRPRKAWTSHDEQRLKAWVREKQDWSEIATRLNRTPSAVEQHWRLMIIHERKASPRMYRFRRASD